MNSCQQKMIRSKHATSPRTESCYIYIYIYIYIYRYIKQRDVLAGKGGQAPDGWLELDR
jgi:hypothetical protein